MRQLRLVLAFAFVGCEDDVDPGVVPDARVEPDAAAACAPLAGAGTTHMQTISAPTTWMAAQSPHLLPAGITVTATLTIEACAVVRIADDRSITVRTGGSLVAAGVAGKPVT